MITRDLGGPGPSTLPDASAATARTSHAAKQRNTSRIDSFDAVESPQFANFVLSGYAFKATRF